MTLAPSHIPTVSLAVVADDARAYTAASRSVATNRSYRTGWELFCGWCVQRDRKPLPASADTVALFVADLARVAKPSTIDARLAAISSAHRTAGLESPTRSEQVRTVRRGVRRTVGTAQRRVRAVSVPDLRAMVTPLGDGPADRRDRALLLVGFAGAFRRSELVGLDLDDVTEGPEGLTIRLRRSKTDQEGTGRLVGVPYGSQPATCPVMAWNGWTAALGAIEGPAFRPIDRHGNISKARLSPHAVAEVLKHHAVRAGIDPATVAGHSLRAGLATAAAAAGVPERVIAATTGHQGTTVLRRYIREGSLFRENAASHVGL